MQMRWLTRAAMGADLGFAVLALLVMFTGNADAQYPQPWQFGFQEAASPVKHRIEGLHNLLLVIITLITLFVLVLLVYVMVRFRASANPKPSRTAHNTTIEIIWTVIPIVILVV